LRSRLLLREDNPGGSGDEPGGEIVTNARKYREQRDEAVSILREYARVCRVDHRVKGRAKAFLDRFPEKVAEIKSEVADGLATEAQITTTPSSSNSAPTSPPREEGPDVDAGLTPAPAGSKPANGTGTPHDPETLWCQ
jgi:hypothetical protein